MANFNLARAEVAGRITNDVEVKMSRDGKSVLKLRIAVNRRRGGEQKTTFFTAVIWGTAAETVGKFFKKGSSIYVAGELDANEWVTRDGAKRSEPEIAVDLFRFVDSASERDTASTCGTVTAESAEFMDIGDGELPF